ncbi:MAG: 8-amino-7-oxononanoate synthase [Gammaproteobacteria bacterium]|nr:8-amino-7-oxononanoate synthase [Gammaproteobacteria bacterium]
MSNPRDLEAYLDERRAQGLYRTRLTVESPGVELQLGNERLLAFCSNDYLGLATHPDVIAAFQRGAAQYGVGAGASHLVSGHSRAHAALEEELADFVGSERTLLFSTGYMANLGVVTALMQRHDPIYEDRLNHASLIDAARLARARVKRYPHVDSDQLRGALEQQPGGTKLITTDAVFSMDGDLAPLPALLQLAQDHGAYLLADDAHGLGVLGAHGRGSFEHFGLAIKSPVILMDTLGKAMGTFGAFVAGDAVLIETLIQQARTYTYTTALPPAVAEATRASLKLVQSEPWRRTRLRELVARFRRGASELGFALAPSDTPIQPLILGSANRALAVAAHLRASGIWVPAIRPPTVPAGAARLRITFSSAHDDAHVDRLLEALAQFMSSDDVAH